MRLAVVAVAGVCGAWLLLLAFPLPGSGLAHAQAPGSASDSAFSARAGSSGGTAPAEQRTPPQEGREGAIEELTVVARRRLDEEILELDVVESFDAEELEELGITSIEDLDLLFPNLLIDEDPDNLNASRITFRGIGGDRDPNGGFEEPAIGTFINGVRLPSSEGALVDLRDVERVEFTRRGGFGVGGEALGGGINIVTRRPELGGFRGSARLRIGNYDELETSLSLNLPVVPERVSARLRFSTNQRHGFATNRRGGGNSTVGDNRSLEGSADLLWNARDDLELRFSGSYRVSPRTANPRKCKFFGLGGAPSGGRRGFPLGPTSNQRRLGALSSSPREVPQTLEELDAALTASLDGARTSGAFGEACRQDDLRSNRSVSLDGPIREELTTVRASLTGVWTPLRNFSLTSTSSLMTRDSTRSSDADATGLALSGDFRGGRGDSVSRQLSQRLSARGSFFRRRLRFSATLTATLNESDSDNRDTDVPGTAQRAFFIRSEGTNAERNRRIESALDSDPSLDDPALAALIGADPAFAERSVSGFELVDGVGECVQVDGLSPLDVEETCLRSFVSPRTASTSFSESLSYSGFFQTTFALTRRLSFEASVRFSQSNRKSDRVSRLLNGEAFADRSDPTLQPFGLDSDPTNGGRFLSEARLQSAASTDVTRITSSDSRGEPSFRPNFGLRYTFSRDLRAFFNYSRSKRGSGSNPEILTMYEAGIRSMWFNRALNLDLTGFANVQKDMRRTGGRAITQGAELRLQLRPTRALTLTSNLGVTVPRYIDRPDPTITEFPNTSTYSMSFSVNHNLRLGRLGSLRSNFSWRHQGDRTSDARDNPLVRINKFGVLRGGLTLTLPDRVTTITLSGNNLLDREYKTGVSDLRRRNGSLQTSFGAPRTFGIEINRRF